MDGKSVAERLHDVQAAIAKAAQRCGRDPTSIRLIAVSKKKSSELIAEAVAAGQTEFGENYVQEALAKMPLVQGAQWHFIGSVQTNKVRSLVGRFTLIHSVDREKLLRKIAEEAEKAGVLQNILIEINVAGEESKSGSTPEEAEALVRIAAGLSSIRLCGLMVMPPLEQDAENSRRWFASARQWLETWRRHLATEEQREAFRELSMGTSHDFEAAIAEGSTLVRVGTAIFGERA